MKAPHGRIRYISLLRFKKKANLRSLKRASSKAKSKHLLHHNHRMRLLRKNSLQASKLSHSLRSSALHYHEGKVRSSLHSCESPETLTKRGKISRVSERSIHKIASPRVSTEQDEKEEGDTLVVNRRMTRAMDGDETRKLMTMDTSKSMRFKGFDGAKTQVKDVQRKFKHKGMRKGVLPVLSPQDHMEMENTSYKKKLRHQEKNSTKNGGDKHLGMVVGPLAVENGNHRLTRLDIAKNGASESLNKLHEPAYDPSNEDPKKLIQARAVLKSLWRQKRFPMAGGVTTRHKASSIRQAQPLLNIDRETDLASNKHSQNHFRHIEEGGHSGKAQTGNIPIEVAKKWTRQCASWPHRNGGVVNNSVLNNVGVLTRTAKGRKHKSFYKTEGGGRLTRGEGISKKAQGCFKGGAHKVSRPGDTQPAHSALNHTSSLERRLKKPRKGGGSGSVLLQQLKKRRTINQLDDLKQVITKEASLLLDTSPREVTVEGSHGKNVASKDLKDSCVTPRRSKRKRNTASSEVLNDQEVVHQKSSNLLNDVLQVRGQSEDIAVRDAFHPKGTSSGIEHPLGDDVVIERVPSAPKAVEDEMGSSLDGFKLDSSSNCCLVARNPIETGGRQMRPRPLDLELPLLVLVEGLDQDYYEFDGGSFYRMLQQQPESSNPFISKVKTEGSNRRASGILDATEQKAGPIVIPSFRFQIESDDSLQKSPIPYTLADSYIKASSEFKSCQAEYDMDDEDEEWLNHYNQSVSSASKLSADQFEKIIDLLENKAAEASGFNSISDAFEEEQEPISEECCICNGGENSMNNLDYRCSSCHILVHQSCYGIQKGIRNKQKKRNWNCRKCEAVAEGNEVADISCSLCCKQGGALKPSTEPHKWAHVVCALYTNETYFVNPDAMEPIAGIDAAEARAKRQKRNCWLCGVREGSVERCSVPGCKGVFHVSCGVTQGASFELQHSNDQVISVRVYCPKHALSALDATKARSEEGGKKNENLSFQSSSGHEELVPAAEYISSRKYQTRKQGRRRSLSQSRASGQSASDNSRDFIGMLNNDTHISGRTEQEYLDKSLEGKTCKLAKGGRTVSGVPAEEAYAALIRDKMPEISHKTPGFTEGVYLYWVSKRAKQGGALLHRIQQEHAAKQFGIFNSDDDCGPDTIAASEGSFLRHNITNMMEKPLTLEDLDIKLDSDGDFGGEFPHVDPNDIDHEEAQNILEMESTRLKNKVLRVWQQGAARRTDLEGPPLSYKDVAKLCPSKFVRQVLFRSTKKIKHHNHPKISDLQHVTLSRKIQQRFLEVYKSKMNHQQVPMYFVQQFFVEEILGKRVDWTNIPHKIYLAKRRRGASCQIVKKARNELEHTKRIVQTQEAHAKIFGLTNKD